MDLCSAAIQRSDRTVPRSDWTQELSKDPIQSCLKQNPDTV